MLRYNYTNDVDDVIQDATLKAWTNFSNFEQRSLFSTWFYRIAVNQALMFLRSKKREQLSLEDVTALLSPLISLESCVIAKERNAQLRSAIVALPAKRRCEVLRWSQAERHDPLNMLARNKSARFYARHALQAALGQSSKLIMRKVRKRVRYMNQAERKAYIRARLAEVYQGPRERDARD